MKKLLSLVTFIAVSLVATAQEGATANVWWGIYNGIDPTTTLQGGKASDCCMRVLSSNTFVQGRRIHGLRFALNDVQQINSLRVWLSKKQPTTTSMPDICYIDVDKNDIAADCLTTIMLPEPYDTDGTAFYAGYTITSMQGSPTHHILLTEAISNEAGGLYLNFDDFGWQNCRQLGYGALAMQLLVETEGLPKNSVSPQAERPFLLTTIGQRHSVTIHLNNQGYEPLKAIDYSFADDNDEQPAILHYQLPIPLDAIGNVSMTLPMPASDACIVSKVFKVHQVNGETNENENDATQVALAAIVESAPQRTVMEEFTGTWCGWCPRGIVGMQLLQNDYPDEFIGIAVHVRDVMTIADYEPIASLASAFPSALLNRQWTGDPYEGSTRSNYGIQYDFNHQQQRLVEADMAVKAEWTDPSQSALNIRTEVTPSLSGNYSPYAIAYVVRADSLSGDGTAWAQNNEYANASSDPNLSFWTKAKGKVEGIAYNHVAIAAVDILNGIDGSVNPPLVAGEPIPHSFTIDLTDNQLLQDKRYISVVALLINRLNGNIVNAAECHIDNNDTALTNVQYDSAEPSQNQKFYDPYGRPVTKNYRGLVIDSQNKKIFINSF